MKKRKLNGRIQCIIDNFPTELTSEQKDVAAKLVKSYAEISSKNENALGRAYLIEHTIETANNPPIRETL